MVDAVVSVSVSDAVVVIDVVVIDVVVPAVDPSVPGSVEHALDPSSTIASASGPRLEDVTVVCTAPQKGHTRSDSRRCRSHAKHGYIIEGNISKTMRAATLQLCQIQRSN